MKDDRSRDTVEEAVLLGMFWSVSKPLHPRPFYTLFLFNIKLSSAVFKSFSLSDIIHKPSRFVVE